jgi:hypothetical protein
MAIIAGYFAGETYGLLGPQMAATLIEGHTPWECRVIAVTREDRPDELKRALAAYFGSQKPIIGFSTLGGREDLCALAAELTSQGAWTVLAGPQAAVDFHGEPDWALHPYRFKGLSSSFTLGLQGPAQQFFVVLDHADRDGLPKSPGVLSMQGGRVRQSPALPWDQAYLTSVDWHNLYRLRAGRLTRQVVATGQVLQQIGCPHAARSRRIAIDFPTAMREHAAETIEMDVRGCSFCDVAADKGFVGTLSIASVMAQIDCLPQAQDGRKIAFELINEYPLPGLPDLLDNVETQGITLSQINLTLRADALVQGYPSLQEALKIAGRAGIRIVLSSVGFESFDDRILRNLNKGLDTAMNLRAVDLIRRLKKSYPDTLGYLRSEGGNHGFIHPTPWDTPASAKRIQHVIAKYGLDRDILPNHSTPLIIHHASFLGDWIRTIETTCTIRFNRYGSIIGWWDLGAT